MCTYNRIYVYNIISHGFLQDLERFPIDFRRYSQICQRKVRGIAALAAPLRRCLDTCIQSTLAMKSMISPIYYIYMHIYIYIKCIHINISGHLSAMSHQSVKQFRREVIAGLCIYWNASYDLHPGTVPMYIVLLYLKSLGKFIHQFKLRGQKLLKAILSYSIIFDPFQEVYDIGVSKYQKV